MKTQIQKFRRLRILINFTILSLFFACGSESPSEIAINDFLIRHTEFGNVQFTNQKPDWSDGTRFKVITDKGNYLFYLSLENEVVGVWQENEDGTRSQMYKKENESIVNQVIEDVDLPQYKILDQTDLFSGTGKLGEILIVSYSKNTPKELREGTLRKIMKKEGFVSGMLYSTEEAFKANYSESYSKSHPGALKKGYLGQINEQGEFIE